MNKWIHFVHQLVNDDLLNGFCREAACIAAVFRRDHSICAMPVSERGRPLIRHSSQFLFHWRISIRQPRRTNQTPLTFSQTMEVRAFRQMFVWAVER